MTSNNTSRTSNLRSHLSASIFFLLLLVCLQPVVRAQGLEEGTLNTGEAKRNREMGLAMLKEMKEILEKYYYDPKYHGIDLKARFKAAESVIKTLNHNWQVYRVLAGILLEFNDSHTRLIVPPRTDHFEYGFTLQMIGDQCFVISVKKGSDAEKGGLQAGDQVLKIGRYTPTRQNLWKLIYVIYKLDPANMVSLTVKKPDGTEAPMLIAARTMTEKEYKEERKKRKDDEEAKPFKCDELSADLIACKLYTFVTEKNQIDKMMKQVGQHAKFILDLRGNGGGYVSVQEYLTGYLFDHTVKVSDDVTREKTEKHYAKSKGDKSFKGELVLLVDSQSASASELLARIVQLEKRGKIFGDVTRAAVMTSVTRPLFGEIRALTTMATTYTGMSITIADVIPSDGNRIEGVGVVPDQTILPTALALAKKTDPVLAYVATLLGAKLSPEEARKLYFMTDKLEDADEPDTEP